jgi:FMN-dependent dehydrogenase
VAGSEKGVTARDNVEAFSELGFAPRVAGLTTYREIATTVMGQEISLPVVISPTGVQAVHPDGELAVARPAANRGTAMGLSSFASKPIEDVVAANPKTFFQMYWVGDRDAMAARMERARSAGIYQACSPGHPVMTRRQALAAGGPERPSPARQVVRGAASPPQRPPRTRIRGYRKSLTAPPGTSRFHSPPAARRSPAADNAPRDSKNDGRPRSPQNPHTTHATQDLTSTTRKFPQ